MPVTGMDRNKNRSSDERSERQSGATPCAETREASDRTGQRAPEKKERLATPRAE
jgi:hypothetical protein